MQPIERASASEQIAGDLRRRIASGELAAGAPLPSDAELAARYEVSKPTVTKARAMLVALGLVTSRAGAASIVSDAPPQTPAEPDARRVAARAGRSYPAGHYATILGARLVAAPPDIAEALGVGAGTPVIQRRRMTYGPDEAPLATSTTYLPGDLAEACPALLDTRRIRQGLVAYVAERTGRTASSSVTTAVARAAGADGEALRLAPGACVLVLATTTRDAGGVALAHEVELHPSATPIAFDITT